MYTKQKSVKSILLGVNLLLFSVVTQVTASNQTNSPLTQAAISQEWLRYQDVRFGFSLDYPSDWYMMPRDDSDPEGTSGVLMFTPFDPYTSSSNGEYNDPHSTQPYIAVGLYLAELEQGQSLAKWTELYQEASKSFDAGQIKNEPLETLRINLSDAIRRRGVSPITEYQFTNISHGNTVWFVWTNINDSKNDRYASVYNRMISSFRFSRKTPTRLNDIYGSNFQPLRLKEESSSNVLDNQAAGIWGTTETERIKKLQILALSSSWKSPVVGMYNVQCGSALHTGSSQWAADIGTPLNTSVYAAYSGNVIFAGWDTTGYGNLIKTSHIGGYTAYYAHLNTINVSNGASVATYQFIAKSGNSGPSSIHLHFHVKDQNLTGMSGFSPNTSPPPPGEVVYPSTTVGSCGDMGR